ncbi:hypothetical protein ACHAO9_007710 [Fusarium lateritium]
MSAWNTEMEKPGLSPPFSMRLLRSLADERRHLFDPLMMLFPASFRTQSLDLVTSAYNYHDLIRKELDIKRLNKIQRWLWVAGSTVPPRPLHSHLVMGRDVVLHESMDMHLVWTTGKIFIKPLTLFLLDPAVWKEFMCCQDKCACRDQMADNSEVAQYCERRELYKCAMGFLYSYTALIRHESDFVLAKERHLLPGDISWSNWILFVRELDIEHIYPDINPRFHHRELRLSRLNYIYYITQGSLDGYAHRYNRYSDFFRSHLAWMATATVYVAIVLTAMQVGLATEKLGENTFFQSASYGFTVFALFAPLACAGIVFLVFVFLLVHNTTQTLRVVKRRLVHFRVQDGQGG